MFFAIIEQMDNTQSRFVFTKKDIVELFNTEEKANIQRIYLQPDYDNLLKVIGIE